MEKCTLLVSGSTDLDYCVVFADWVSVFLEHVHRTLNASERFTPNPPSLSPHFACLFILMARTNTAATFTGSPNWSLASFEISHYDKTSGWFSDSSFCTQNKSVCEYYSWTLFMNSVHKDFVHRELVLQENIPLLTLFPTLRTSGDTLTVVCNVLIVPCAVLIVAS